MTTIATAIIIVSILMMFNGKEMLQVGAILLFYYSFPMLALILITLVVLADCSN